MRIVCISDTHGAHDHIEVPAGEVLIHAGDFTTRGKAPEIIAFDNWLGTLPHPHKIVVAGNHDFLFEKKPAAAKSLLNNAIYLNNSGIRLHELAIWGSPVTPWFFDWAFNRRRGADIRRYWEAIPEGTDILITHGPPQGILDATVRGDAAGCADLREIALRRKPRLHVFGHIHEAYGQARHGETQFVNASIMDIRYKPVNAPVVVEM